MYDLNYSVRSGRLTANPELRTSESGKKLVKFQLAVNRSKEEADFFTYTAWGENATFIDRYCRRGTKLIIVGRDITNVATDKSGRKTKYFETVCKEICFAESKSAQEALPQADNKQNISVSADDDDDLPF